MLGQVYVSIVGVIFIPIYIDMLGNEAYGLVAVFSMLQAIFAILDFGLTPTISRETSLYLSGSISSILYKKLRKLLFVIFLGIGLSFSASLLFLSHHIAMNWLNYETLSAKDVINSIQLMILCCFFRWMSGIYRGVISGAEDFKWLSLFNMISSSLKFIGVFLSMMIFGTKAEIFFLHQLAVAIIELIILFNKSSKCARNDEPVSDDIKISYTDEFRKIWKFSLSIAFTSGIWLFITQLDKILLSGILSLKEYGYFTVAVLLANGIFMISGPISQAIMPRMASLYAQDKSYDLKQLYMRSTKNVTILAGSASLLIVALPKTILSLWTGDNILSMETANILRLYSIGNMFLTISAFAYYLQYARGNLYYHLFGNTLLLFILTPSIVIAAYYFGSIGAGFVWLIANFLFLFLWVGYVHYKLEPGLHKYWIVDGFIKIIIPGGIISFLVALYLDDISSSVILKLIKIISVGLILMFLSFLLSRVDTHFTHAFKGK
ncbi:polysaccharide biosynthesis protein [Vibrio cholerae]|nr:putative O-antigen flippase [Vibrio cholerae]GHZ93417.1 polysaccharide biosynthesis protein [Vibrio cholerae]